MKKLLLLLSMLVLWQLPCIAQTKGSLDFSSGIGIPLGEFAKASPGIPSAGFAQMSTMLVNVSITKNIFKNMGATLLISLQNHETNVSAMSIDLCKRIGASYDSDALAGASSWNLMSFRFGPHVSFKLQKKLTFQSNLLFGCLIANSPSVAHLNYYGIWQVQYSGGSYAAVASINAGIRYNFIERVCLLASTEFMCANPRFKNIKMETSYGTEAFVNLDKPIRILNCSLGLAYLL